MYVDEAGGDAGVLCGGPIGLQGGRPVGVTPGMSYDLDDVFGLGLPYRPDRWKAIPSVVGRPLDAAIAFARKRGYAIDVHGQVYAPSMRLGRVAVQVPFASGHNDISDAEPRITVKLAVGPAPRCGPTDVEARYRASGENVGYLLLRNPGRRTCRLAGTLLLTGIDGSGNAVTPIHRLRIAFPAVLPPPVAHDLQGWLTAGVALSSYPWSDPNAPGASCPSDQRSAPTSWRVRVPGAGVHTVGNRSDPSTGPDSVPLETCRGSFGTTEVQTG
jgi:hypothetical protein